jgi:pimeloyl-ACP methyl ester carboxylesterase
MQIGALGRKGYAMSPTPHESIMRGYAPLHGLRMYYEVHGAGPPLVLIHGGLGQTEMLGDLLPHLAAHRQVIVADLQGHGRTADTDRPLRLELLADDIAALIGHLGLAQVDLMGYSMGGGTALRTAIQHPDLIRKLVVVSFPHTRDAWYPEVRAGMAAMGAAAAAMLEGSPPHQAYVRVAPNPAGFPALLEKMGDMLRQGHDWSVEVSTLPMPVMLVFGDADSIPPAQAAAFFALLGGGQADAGWDGAHMPRARLSILPGVTHYDIFASPALAAAVIPFLDAPTAIRG